MLLMFLFWDVSAQAKSQSCLYEGSQACDAEGGSNPHVQGVMKGEVEPDTITFHNWWFIGISRKYCLIYEGNDIQTHQLRKGLKRG